MVHALTAAELAKKEEKASALRDRSRKGQGMNSFATVAKILDTANHATNMELKKLDEHVINTARQTSLRTLEKCNSDHDKVFVRWEVQNSLQDLLASILKYDAGFQDAFETTVVSLAGTGNLIKEANRVLINDATILALIGTFVVKMANEAVNRALKPKASVAISSPPTLRFNKLPSENKMNSRKAA